ncbi:cation transport regulator-like protein 2 [Diplocarpon rosae]|nr:cation transport regulator-like protein 2 [Diplocarpon rosae]
MDRRIPGWVTGYVRRFWQVCSSINGRSKDRLMNDAGQSGSSRNTRGTGAGRHIDRALVLGEAARSPSLGV